MQSAGSRATPVDHAQPRQNDHAARNANAQDSHRGLLVETEQETGKLKDVLVRFYTKFTNDWTMNLVAMVSYNVLTSFFPLVLALITILALIPSASGNTAAFANQINTILPSDVRQNIHVESLLHAVSSAGGLLSVISIAGLLWGGSNLFGSIESAFAVIFRVKMRDFLPQKLMSLAMILLFVVLLPLSFVSSLFLGSATTALGKIMPSALNGPVAQVLGFATSFLALFVLFAAIYTVVPNIPISWRHAWRGALVAGIAMWVVNTIFPFYTAHFVGTAQYGQAALGTAVISITWFWFFSLVLLIGAQVNALAMDIGPWPYDLARVLMEYKIPTKGGQPTATESLRNEHTPEQSDKVLGLARDSQNVEDPAARGARGKEAAGSSKQAAASGKESTGSAARAFRDGNTAQRSVEMQTAPEVSAVAPETQRGFLLIGAVAGLVGVLISFMRRNSA